ncbi:F-box domain-containing protein [Mycena sanguinolenta]|uniref:F-box domain-containing protein n=1 Tax=Mycena sanguinolenta TaxID=230812 RepID=A0A8H7DL99_9AGAR|nr:F-box domain-containing protein [Mycena sanguinolenta]
MLAQPASKSNETVAILPSEINQFSAELFVEIFVLCWRSFTPPFDDIYRSGEPQDSSTTVNFEFKTEIARLAHAPLLIVARVCRKWRSIAMGTSLLWCDIELDSVLWASPAQRRTAFAVLESTLTRGGNSPLNITLTQRDHPIPFRVFSTLAAHSQRWETFSCPSHLIGAFSSIQDRLPRLQWLHLGISQYEPGSLDYWNSPSLPSLTSLILGGEILGQDMRNLPLEQLRQFECGAIDQSNMKNVMSLMPRLSPGTEFRFLVHQLDEPEDWAEIERVTSNISIFYLHLLGDFNVDYSLKVLECVLDAITLPCLTQFVLESLEYPCCPLLWSHRAFLALCARSSFDCTLRTLEIYDVHITEAQLVECLSHLPSLERLAISDHQPIAPISARAGVGANEVLVTDTLLAKLTHTADSDAPSLVPRLSSLGCQTLMHFDDRALLALVVSRLSNNFDTGQPQDATGPQFGIELSWLPGRERKIDEAVLARLYALRISTNRRFTFRMSAAEDEWI